MTEHLVRSEFVRAFLASGQTQAEFCAVHRPRGGPSERTLRSWLSALSKPAGFTAEARAIVQQAVTDLQNLLRALDAVEHAQVTPETDDARVDAPPAAARSLPATRAARAEVPGTAAAERRSAGAPESPRTAGPFLDDLRAAVKAAVAAAAEANLQVDADAEPAVRPAPFADPWSRGGGFLGPF